MDGENKTIDFLARMDPTSASSSTRPLQASPKPSRKNDEAEAHKPAIRLKQRYPPLNLNMDPERFKRIMVNRASADRTRLRRQQYIQEMETKAKTLEAQVMMMSPQVGFYQQQQEMLLMERESLKRKISKCASDKYHKEAEIEENKFWLRQLKSIMGKQKEIIQAWHKGKMVPYGVTNNPAFNNFTAQIGENPREVPSKLREIKAMPAKKEEGQTGMPIPRLPKMVPLPPLSTFLWSKPEPKANSKPKDPLSLSLGINE